MSEPINFEDELRRLEEIVRALEGEDLELGDALTLFEEGVERVRQARDLLREAEAKVRELGDGVA